MRELHIGRGASAGALTVFPVWADAPASRGYGVDDAELVVSEMPDGPCVGCVLAKNRSDAPLLLLEGVLLEGGWQTRSLTRSVLLPAAGTLDVEVVCVEQGRWSGGATHRTAGRRASTRIRAAARRRTEEGAQGAVWRRVSEYDARFGESPTSSYADHADRGAADVRRLVAGMRLLPGQLGVVIGIGGQPFVAEVFDSPLTLRQQFSAIIEAAGMDALDQPIVPTPARRAIRLVDRAAGLSLRPIAAAGLGTTVTGSSEHASVDALAWRRRLVHTTVTNVRHPLNAGA